MEWTGLVGGAVAAVSSLGTIATIIYYMKDNSRYRREREQTEDEWTGQLKERLENIDNKLEKQEKLCFAERKSIWDRLDDCADSVSFLKGKLNGVQH